MKTTISKLFVILTVGVVALATTNALADGGNKGNKGNKGGGNKGGFGISFGNVGVRVGGGNNGLKKNGNNGGCHNGGGYNNGGYNNTCQTNGGVYGQAFEPFHSSYICQPGDSFYTVSLKEYGTSSNQYYVAKFNGLAPNAALVPGQRLVLPSISANGQLNVSNRPAGVGDTTPVQGFPFTTPTTTPTTSNLTQAVSSVTSNFASAVKPAATEPALPKVTVGSTLVLDGQTFGEEQGVARLRVSGLALPVEVLEWTNSSVKVRLPQVELTSATKVELEVLRADGSLASKSAIELTPAADRLAQTN
jgi:hypothetical protein